MNRFEYLAFEQRSQLYGILIDQIDVISKQQQEAGEPVDNWLGFNMTGSDPPRLVRIKSSGQLLVVLGVRGIWTGSMDRVWPIPKLIASHRPDRLFWGVCPSQENPDRLVLLVDPGMLQTRVSDA